VALRGRWARSTKWEEKARNAGLNTGEKNGPGKEADMAGFPRGGKKLTPPPPDHLRLATRKIRAAGY